MPQISVNPNKLMNRVGTLTNAVWAEELKIARNYLETDPDFYTAFQKRLYDMNLVNTLNNTIDGGLPEYITALPELQEQALLDTLQDYLPKTHNWHDVGT